MYKWLMRMVVTEVTVESELQHAMQISKPGYAIVSHDMYSSFPSCSLLYRYCSGRTSLASKPI